MQALINTSFQRTDVGHGLQIFRDAEGHVVQSKGIHISLEDLICEHILAKAGPNRGEFMNLDLFIKPEELCAFFDKAKKAQEKGDSRRKKLKVLNAQSKPRKTEIEKLGDSVLNMANLGRREILRGIDKGLKKSWRLRKSHA